jgi:beta-phosphoglucomutase-like phosphatase (HAD superfamily)
MAQDVARAAASAAYALGLLFAAPKPSPDVYILAAKILASSPEQYLVVEDSPAGVAAARAAGMTVIGFSPPAGCPCEFLRQAGASSIISELCGLLVQLSR